MILPPHGFRFNAKTTKHVRICMYLQELRIFKRLALTSFLFCKRLVSTLFAWLHTHIILRMYSIPLYLREIGSRRKRLPGYESQNMTCPFLLRNTYGICFGFLHVMYEVQCLCVGRPNITGPSICRGLRYSTIQKSFILRVCTYV